MRGGLSSKKNSSDVPGHVTNTKTIKSVHKATHATLTYESQRKGNARGSVGRFCFVLFLLTKSTVNEETVKRKDF